ncbi:MAG: 30S ribosomal protein S1, partial [Bacteroidota bacterium]
HTRMFNEKAAEIKKQESNEREAEVSNTAKAVKKLKDSQEKSTLGDISALAALKNTLEGGNQDNA